MSQLGSGAGAAAPGEAAAAQAAGGMRAYARPGEAARHAAPDVQVAPNARAARKAHVEELRRRMEAERRQEAVPSRARSSGATGGASAAAEAARIDAARRASNSGASTSGGGLAPPQRGRRQGSSLPGRRPGPKAQPAISAAAPPVVNAAKLEALRGQEGVTFPGSSTQEDFAPSFLQGPVGLPVQRPPPSLQRRQVPAAELNGGSSSSMRVDETVVLDAAKLHSMYIDHIMGEDAQPAVPALQYAEAPVAVMAGGGARQLVGAAAGGGSRGWSGGGAHSGSTGSFSTGYARQGSGRHASQPGNALSAGLERGQRPASAAAEQVCFCSPVCAIHVDISACNMHGLL